MCCHTLKDMLALWDAVRGSFSLSRIIFRGKRDWGNQKTENGNPDLSFFESGKAMS